MKNNNFDKAMNAPDKKARKRYQYKELYTYHAIFYPLMVAIWWLDHWIEAFKYGDPWSADRTQRILSYAFPKRAEVDKANGEISRYIRSWGFYWKPYAKWYDKWYCEKFNSKITEYLYERFEMDGYEKTVDKEDSDWTLVIFKKI
jgi:hypothetical protein